MPFLSIDDMSFYYEVHGRGPALVFCHGSGGNHLSWWQQVPYFSQRYTCITFDHRAFGRSHDRPGGPGRAAFAPDVIALLDHLGIEKVAVVAQSMGGRTAVGLTLRVPARIRALVFSGTTAGCIDTGVRALQEQYRAANGGRADVIVRGLSPAFTRRCRELTFLYRSIARINPRKPPDFLAPRPGYQGSVAAHLAALKLPTLFLTGEDDVITPAPVVEAAARLVPHAQFICVPGAGHSVYFERPDLFNSIVSTFLADCCD
jgi:3-oxoadipate enol-lactonase